ncbi:MAG: hypothetical protein FWF34_03270 [Alphaproteobacteria bacterium]|nr:hypothetical protein [Alphaproteobacteria bacterium]MCL2890252.1 hypothetical protein [Alphaproteobacteria bacterium]
MKNIFKSIFKPKQYINLTDADGTPIFKIIYKTSASGAYAGYYIYSSQMINGQSAYADQPLYIEECNIKMAFEKIAKENLVLHELWGRTESNIEGHQLDERGQFILGKAVVAKKNKKRLEISKNWGCISFAHICPARANRYAANDLTYYTAYDSDIRQSLLADRKTYSR